MLKFYRKGEVIIAELTDDDLIISQVQDVLDLIGDMGTENCSSLIIRQQNLHPDFFHLKTRLAGEILQKISNYRFRLAIIGDFSIYSSKSFRDFVLESNSGNRVFFLNNIDDAFRKVENSRPHAYDS
jgi:hypothetical protein